MGNLLAGVACAITLVLPACEKQLTGSALPLNMQPPPPQFAGAYDFELLDSVRGKACVRRGYPLGAIEHHFWISGANLDKVARDPLTADAIGAAAFDAINGLQSADTIVVTRVVTESDRGDEVCASVYGRAIRLTKAGPVTASPSPTPPTPPRTTPTGPPHHDDDLMKPLPF